VLKGIVRGDDARLAAEHGADAVIVSNHGGRQVDGAIATVDALPAVVEGAATASRPAGAFPMEVYLDGGVRRGTHVLIARALGARAVFVGRPWMYALAAGGEAGVARLIALMRAEVETAMRLLGVASLDAVTPAHVRAV